MPPRNKAPTPRSAYARAATQKGYTENGEDFLGTANAYWGPLSSYFGDDVGAFAAYTYNGWLYSDSPA